MHVHSNAYKLKKKIQKTQPLPCSLVQTIVWELGLSTSDSVLDDESQSLSGSLPSTSPHVGSDGNFKR